MRSTLEELWYGNICPETDSRTNTPEMKRLMEYMARHHDSLMGTMTDEQKKLLDAYVDKCGTMSCHLEYSSFLVGFKVATRLLAEAIYDRENE